MCQGNLWIKVLCVDQTFVYKCLAHIHIYTYAHTFDIMTNPAQRGQRPWKFWRHLLNTIETETPSKHHWIFLETTLNPHEESLKLSQKKHTHKTPKRNNWNTFETQSFNNPTKTFQSFWVSLVQTYAVQVLEGLSLLQHQKTHEECLKLTQNKTPLNTIETHLRLKVTLLLLQDCPNFFWFPFYRHVQCKS